MINGAPGGSTREWLFKTEGQVFGPVPEPTLVELLFQGRVGAATEVAGADGAWRPLAQVPGFLVHVRKAEAHARVEAEVTGARRLERRRGVVRTGGAAVAAVALLALAAWGAWSLAVKRPWERRSRLLDDFGNGIAMSDVRVGSGPRSDPDEVAVPVAEEARATASTARASRAPAPRAHRGGGATLAGGEIVLAHYDVRRIQEVVARRQGGLAPCLREEARRSPEFQGEIPIEFAVGNDGKVAQLWIDEPRFKSGELRDCLERKLREWAFDPFPGERPVVSFAFRLGGR